MRTMVLLTRLMGVLGLGVTVPRKLSQAEIDKETKINWFLIHDSKQLMKKVFLDSLVRTNVETKVFLDSLIRNNFSKSLIFCSLFRNRNSETDQLVSNQLFLCQSLVTGGKDGCVRVWDPRQKGVPVAEITPEDSQKENTRDCWTVAFGNSYNAEGIFTVASI